MAKVLEFDQFLSEAAGETLTVRVRGKAYEVPCRIPAIVPLMMARASKLADQSSRSAAYSDMIFSAADALFGCEAATEICASGLYVEDLALLVQKVFGLINGTQEDGESEELTDEDSRSSLPGDSAKK